MTRNNLSQVNNRLAEVEQELHQIHNDEKAETTLIPSEGEFDHTAWLMAEREELCDEQDDLTAVVTVEGGVDYE